MTARHRESESPTQRRLQILVVVMTVLLALGVAFFRGAADTGGPDDTTPSAGGSTSTTNQSGATTEPGNSSSSTGGGGGGSTLPALQSVVLEKVFDGEFRQPVAMASPPDDERLFVVQRVGVIRILDESRQMLDPAFLDISDRVLAGGIEQGLLGLAFHPDYANNRRFFVYYTDKGGRRQLSEFTATVSDPNRALADSERVLIELEQPENATDIRHYAGNVAFGPDGYLWLSMGDGADSKAQAQDPNTMFGSIIRIDVDGGDPYGIPSDNPFVGGGGAPEVWAYGLRNPWRFSIDPVDNLVYIADVGHADIEEVEVVSAEHGGYNFGWSDMEGDRCFHKSGCDPADYTSPVIMYHHTANEDDPDAVVGLSVTGGFVYRGSEIPELQGTYFYSDWVSQWIRSFKYVDGQATEERDWTNDFGGKVGQVTSFGQDSHGELYFTTWEGLLYKLSADR